MMDVQGPNFNIKALRDHRFHIELMEDQKDHTQCYGVNLG